MSVNTSRKWSATTFAVLKDQVLAMDTGTLLIIVGMQLSETAADMIGKRYPCRLRVGTMCYIRGGTSGEHRFVPLAVLLNLETTRYPWNLYNLRFAIFFAMLLR